ncbi:MAG: hypothetical protein KF696_10055 [Planctomycetes bacterium]|nr:hypothetical protein [Planctomycetota bacterium]MCW8136200.1 hypothetical protein [Planctomycetota bacterium]
MTESIEGTEVVAGKRYEGGERLKISLMGLSFKVPQGSAAGWPERSIWIEMGNQEGEFAMMIPHTGMTRAQGREVLEAPLKLPGQQGEGIPPQGAIKEEGDNMWRAYANDGGAMVTMLVLGKRCTVMLVGQGPGYTAESALTYIKKVTDSFQFAEPKVTERGSRWTGGLKGKCLHVYKYRSSSGGGSSMSWETDIQWHLGSDGTYYYAYKYTGSGSVSGSNQYGDETYRGGTASDNNNEHEGRWRIEHTLITDLLVLTDTKGKTRTWVLQDRGGKVYVDDDEASVSASNRKP